MSGNNVQLYVYDLSRGMARQMSQAVIGKQVDGIWHTSVVVFGREYFFGQGILEAAPGTTHHGQPQQVIECGETYIDEDTFQEYLIGLADVYTASAYHLIDFNCNNFTADVVGFLTGTTIPDWITGLPAEFLATPLGQMIKPQIDAFFRGTNSSEHRVMGRTGSSAAAEAAAPPVPAPAPSRPAAPAGQGAANGNARDLATALFGAMAAHAAGNAGASPAVGTSAGASSSAPSKPTPQTTPLTLVTSFANWTNILERHPCVIANFTNTPGCPPCRVIKPAYESIAESSAAVYGPKGVRFVEIELGMGEGQQIASQYGVSATPTFIFFKDGKKAEEMRGADKRSLEAKVEAFLDECFPQHPHKRLYLAATSRISTNPITATATPAYPALLGKLEGFAGTAGKKHVDVLRNDVVPFLEGKGKGVDSDAAVSTLIDKWTAATSALVSSLKPAETFPVVDLWRIGLLNTRVVAAIALRLSPGSNGAQPLGELFHLTASTLAAQGTSSPRPLVLTTLRLATNLLAPLPLANLVLGASSQLQADLLTVLVDSLLHSEVSVRKAAADVAVNAAAWRHRLAKQRAAAEGIDGEEDADEVEWESELLVAVLEGIEREQDADVGHRLVVASALLIYLSPGFENVQSMLEVLNARSTLKEAGKRWGKPDVRKLTDEVATKLF